MRLPVIAGATLAVFAASLVGINFVAPKGEASSHREAPRISQMPAVDNVDTYVFRTQDAPDTVTLAATWIPFEEPSGGPNFYHFDDNARYNIKIDRDGDGAEDITYTWTFRTDTSRAGDATRPSSTFLYNTGPIPSTFDNANFKYRQSYTLTETIDGGPASVLISNKLMVPDNVGPRSTPNYPAIAQNEITTGNLSGGGTFKEFTGQRADMFFVDVGSIFDLGTLRPLNTFYNKALGPLPATPGINSVAGFNVHANVLQVPITRLTGNACNPNAAGALTNKACVVGVWSTADKLSTTVLTPGGGAPIVTGPYVQVSRLGHPLVNEAVIDLNAKDVFNAIGPAQDVATLTGAPNSLASNRVADPELARLYPVLYPDAFPNAASLPAVPRNDLITIYLTGIDLPTLTIQQQNSAATPSEQLRINLSVPPSAGTCEGKPMGILDGDVAGYPNGRRLEDDVTDIALRAVAGATPLTPEFNKFPNNALTDGVQKPATKCLSAFPYLGTANDGYYRQHANHWTTAAPLNSVQTMNLLPTGW